MAFSRQLEIETLNKMIMIYCQKVHGSNKNELCPECMNLQQYAEHRIEKCLFGDEKPVCSKCKVHCYKPEMRAEIKKVMKYAGPKMLFSSPLLSIRHFYRAVFKSNNM